MFELIKRLIVGEDAEVNVQEEVLANYFRVYLMLQKDQKALAAKGESKVKVEKDMADVLGMVSLLASGLQESSGRKAR